MSSLQHKSTFVLFRTFVFFSIRNWSHITSHRILILLVILVETTSSTSPRLRRFKSDRDKLWLECTSRKYAPTDQVGFSIWPDSFKMSAMTSFHAENCCHLKCEHEAPGQRQFLISSTFVLVILEATHKYVPMSNTNVLLIRNWRTLLHMRRADAACALIRWQCFSGWNDVMAASLKVWRQIENPTPSIDTHLLEEHSCQISPRSNLKGWSVRLF